MNWLEAISDEKRVCLSILWGLALKGLILYQLFFDIFSVSRCGMYEMACVITVLYFHYAILKMYVQSKISSAIAQHAHHLHGVYSKKK